MRMLVVDDEARLAAHKLVEFASRPENHYRPHMQTADALAPGDDTRYVLHLGEFRCVYTMTVTDEGTYRHLSISVPEDGRYPNPAITVEIARLFGFKGVLEDWMVALNPAEKCVVLLQPI